MHKHGVSGHGGKSPKQKVNQTRRANQEIEAASILRRKRENAYPKFSAPSDAFKAHKNT